MNELSLFTGAGGGLLGTKLLGWKHRGYVENNDNCQRIISQRIKDGILDEAPIFGDIRTFISEGYAEAYQGMVDVVTGGFPCQPFSFAGKRAGPNDPRNMWPATGECIRIIRPRYVLLENVPGLLAHPYARRIFGDLAESGYCVPWRCLSAAEVGANHKRDRLWIVAVSESNGAEERQPELNTAGRDKDGNVAYRNGTGCEERRRPEPVGEEHAASECGGEDVPISRGWWSVEPNVGRVAHGVAFELDLLRTFAKGEL